MYKICGHLLNEDNLNFNIAVITHFYCSLLLFTIQYNRFMVFVYFVLWKS